MYEYKATVLRVVDGDTLDLDLDLGLKVHTHQRVRLAGVNTPETYGVKKESQEYQDGLKAKERVIELVEGKEILVETQKDKAGKYGRYLVEIWLDDNTNLNTLLLEEGLAVPYFGGKR